MVSPIAGWRDANLKDAACRLKAASDLEEGRCRVVRDDRRRVRERDVFEFFALIALTVVMLSSTVAVAVTA